MAFNGGADINQLVDNNMKVTPAGQLPPVRDQFGNVLEEGKGDNEMKDEE